MEKLGTIIHGIGASEHLDSSGERIEVKGIDTSSLTVDGLINFEHKSETSSQLIGKIIEAVKILKKEDCKNKHHEYFWEKAGKTPYLYIKAVLFDKFGHVGASDAVAMLNFDKAMSKEENSKETRQVAGFSVEGSRLEKEGSLIKKCIARKMSFTAYPCNKACVAEILEPESEKKEGEGKLITLAELKAAFKKSQDIEMDLMKAEGKYNLGLSHKLKPQAQSSTRNYTKISAGHGEHRPAKPIVPKQTVKPSQVTNDTKLKTGTRIQYSPQKPKTGSSIYNNPETWKSELETMSNSRKAILKNITDKKRLVMMSEKNMKRKELLKSMSEEAYSMFPHKDELLKAVKQKMPEASEQEVLAFAKTFAYVQQKKSEINLEEIAADIENEKN